MANSMSNSSSRMSASKLAFCLEYTNHKSDMMDAFFQNLNDENMVDVILSCEGHSIKAHKMILSAGSTYFRDIFSAFKSPFQYPVVIIKDMPFRDLKAIVEFLYRGAVVVPVEQVSSLSRSAQSLNIKGLEKYFHKSAVVNVANARSSAVNGCDLGANTLPVVNNAAKASAANVVAKTAASISTKQTAAAVTVKTTGMNLRRKSRPNYRQLSNGDISGESDSDHEPHMTARNRSQNVIHFRAQQQTGPHIVYGSSHQNQEETEQQSLHTSTPLQHKQIKTEYVYEDSSDIEIDMSEIIGPNRHFQIGMDNNDNAVERVPNDANYSDANYANNNGNNEPSTSRYTPSLGINFVNTSPLSNSSQSEPRGVIKNPIRITPRKVKTPFMGRHPRRRKASSKKSANARVVPIKADPDNVEIVRCAECPRVFSQISSLNLHMKRIHGDDNKEHVCELCGKKYSWRSGLYKHMRTHQHSR